MPYSYNLGKRLFKLPEADKKQKGRPLKVKSGLRGRPKILPSGTLEWLRQSLNNDVFCHPTNMTEEKVRFEDALPSRFYKMDTKRPNCRSKITICLSPLLLILTVI